MTPCEIGARFIAIREDQGIRNPTAMSKHLGIGMNAWKAYECGEGRPSWSTLEKLAALGYDLNWIVGGYGAMKLIEGAGTASGALVTTSDQQGLLGPSPAVRSGQAEEIYRALSGAMHALRSYQFGNAAPDLARGTADALQALLERLGHSARAGASDGPPDVVASLQALKAALALAGFVSVKHSN